MEMLKSKNYKLKNVEFSYTHNANSFTLSVPSLDIDSGERVLITGNSGSGKSSLFRLITGFYPALYRGNLSGNVKYGGKDIEKYSSAELFSQICVVPQNYNLLGYTPYVLTELVLKLENANWERSDILEWLKNTDNKYFDLEKLGLQFPSSLSAGEKQLLLFLRATSIIDSWIIMDEPFAGVDFHSSFYCLDLISKLLEDKNIGFITFSHNFMQFQSLVDRIIILDKGKITGDFLIKELSEEKIIQLMKPVIPSCEHVVPDVTCPQVSISTSLSLFDYKALFTQKSGSKVLFSLDSFETKFSSPVVLTGKTGSGKSTLLHRLSCLLHDDSGSLQFQKKGTLSEYETVELNKDIIHKYVSISLQNPRLSIRGDNVFEDLMYSLPHPVFTRLEKAFSEKEPLTFSLSQNQSEETLKIENSSSPCGIELSPEGVLQYLELSSLLSQDPKTLSAGELKKLSFFKAYFSGTPWILFDEPTANLDSENRNKIISLLYHKILLEKQGIIISSHDPFLLLTLGCNLWDLDMASHSSLKYLLSVSDNSFFRWIRLYSTHLDSFYSFYPFLDFSSKVEEQSSSRGD